MLGIPHGALDARKMARGRGFALHASGFGRVATMAASQQSRVGDKKRQPRTRSAKIGFNGLRETPIWRPIRAPGSLPDPAQQGLCPRIGPSHGGRSTTPHSPSEDGRLTMPFGPSHGVRSKTPHSPSEDGRLTTPFDPSHGVRSKTPTVQRICPLLSERDQSGEQANDFDPPTRRRQLENERN